MVLIFSTPQLAASSSNRLKRSSRDHADVARHPEALAQSLVVVVGRLVGNGQEPIQEGGQRRAAGAW